MVRSSLACEGGRGFVLRPHRALNLCWW